MKTLIRLPSSLSFTGRTALSALLTVTCMPACSHDDSEHTHDQERDDHDHSTAQECSGHGHLHGTECHCDNGYVASEDGSQCLEDTGDTDPGASTDTGDDSSDTSTSAEFDLDEAELEALTGTDGAGARLWFVGAVADDMVLQVEIYEEFGGPTEPGVVVFDEVETNYATCGTCLVLQTGCSAHDDHFHCGSTFMPRAEGELHLDTLDDTVGGLIEGEFRELVFQEVIIDDDLNTTPVPGGREIRLVNPSFSLELGALDDAPAPECGGHGHRHDDHCHCDDGYRVDPNNALNCVPE